MTLLASKVSCLQLIVVSDPCFPRKSRGHGLTSRSVKGPHRGVACDPVVLGPRSGVAPNEEERPGVEGLTLGLGIRIEIPLKLETLSFWFRVSPTVRSISSCGGMSVDPEAMKKIEDSETNEWTF